MAEGLCPPGAAAEQVAGSNDPQCAPAQAQAKPHLREYCPHCNGKGVIVDNMLQGTTKPCPVCQATVEWTGEMISVGNCADAMIYDEPDGNVSIDSAMPFPEPPSGIVYTPSIREAVKQAKAEIMKQFDGKFFNPPVSERKTATEVNEDQKQKLYEWKMRNHARNYGMKDAKISKLAEQEKVIQQAKNDFLIWGFFGEDTIAELDRLGINLSNWKGT